MYICMGSNTTRGIQHYEEAGGGEVQYNDTNGIEGSVLKSEVS